MKKLLFLFMSVFVLTFTSNAQNLVAYWPFNEGTGDIVADASGNGLDGTLFEGTEGALDPYEWVDGISGKAVHLTRDYMKTPADSAFALNSFTFSAWIKLTAELTEWGAVYTWGTNTSDYVQFGFNKSTRQMYFFTSSDGRGLEFGASTPLELDEWYNIALTIDDAGTVSIYLNGELDGQSTGLKPISKTSTVKPAAIGAGLYDGWEGNVMEGVVVDEVRIYDGPLSANEIKRQYDEMNMKNNLVAYWTFDEGVGDTVADHSGNGFTGRLFEGSENALDPYEWVDGVSGKAVHLTRDYMKTPEDSAFAMNSFSFNAWVKLNAELTEWGAIYTWATNTSDYIQFGFNKSTRQLYFYTNSDSRGLEFGANTPLDLNKWYFVSFTIDDAGNVIIYLNGKLDGQGSGLKPISNTGRLKPAALGAGLHDGWEGNVMEDFVIDEVSIFKGVLSENQIKQMALGKSPDLVARWIFDEGSGNIAHDVSGNNIDMILANTDDSNWIDGGIHFNGVDQYGIVSKENSSKYFENPNFTIASWINVEQDIIVDGNARLAGMDDPYGINLKGADDDGRVKVYVWDGSSWTGDYITSKSFSDGTWHHFAVTHDTISGSVAFIDGIKAGTVNNPDIKYVQNSFFAIAASVSPDSTNFKWFADAGFKDMRVYGRVLSDDEIAVLAGVAGGKEPGMGVMYSFDEFDPGDGNMVPDVSGNLRDGTQHGMYINKVEGVYGSAIEFNPDVLGLDPDSDPNNNSVVLPEDEIFASQAFTIVAWINPATDTLVFDPTWGEWGAIFAHDIGGAADYGLFYDPYGATMGVWSEGMGNAYLGGGTINVGEWAHVALTVNAEDSVMTLYVNGEDVANTKLSVLLPEEAVADTSCIGGSIEKSKPFFGTIDEFAFYNVALDSATIADMAIRRYSLTTEVSNSGGVDLGGITIDPEMEDGIYMSGETVVLTAAPINDNYTFSGWEGAYTGTDNPLTIVMDSNIYVKAVFVEKKYNVTINIVGPGTVSPESGEYNGLVIFTATPGENAKFSHWSGDIGAADSSNAMLILTVDADKDVTATFLDITGIEDNSADDLGLQAYPNPFSDFTTIKYKLEESSEVRISVMNMVGKEVMVLENQFQNPGEYTIEWNGTDASGNVLPNGIYIYRIKAGDTKVANKKLLINR